MNASDLINLIITEIEQLNTPIAGKLLTSYSNKKKLLVKIIDTNPGIGNVFLLYFKILKKFEDDGTNINDLIIYQIDNLTRILNWIDIYQRHLNNIKSEKNFIIRRKKTKLIESSTYGQEYESIFMAKQYDSLKNNVIDMEVIENNINIVSRAIKQLFGELFPLP